MKSIVFKEYIKPLLVLTGICLVLSAALAGVNALTEPVITEAAGERAAEAMRGILPDAAGFAPIEFDFSVIEDSNTAIREAYRAVNDAGYIFIASVNSGYSGEIRIICAVGNDGRIIAAQPLAHAETQGIGTIIEEESFLSQFAGADAAGLSSIDTVTGATISTRAFIAAVDGVMNAFELIEENGK